MLLVGGNSVAADVDYFRVKGANILIATPGRLEDLLTRNCDINLPSAVKSLVCINLHITVVCSGLVGGYRCFGQIYCLHL